MYLFQILYLFENSHVILCNKHENTFGLYTKIRLRLVVRVLSVRYVPSLDDDNI